MDAIGTVSTALAAVAALLSAVSALASWRATRAVEANVTLNRAATRYDLFRSFEAAYSELYPMLWSQLGPWQDPVQVDPDLRRAVHDLLQTLSSIYNARQLALIDPEQSEYLSELYFDWLRLPRAQQVWANVFRGQDETWPTGFVRWVDTRLAG